MPSSMPYLLTHTHVKRGGHKANFHLNIFSIWLTGQQQGKAGPTSSTSFHNSPDMKCLHLATPSRLHWVGTCAMRSKTHERPFPQTIQNDRKIRQIYLTDRSRRPITRHCHFIRCKLSLLVHSKQSFFTASKTTMTPFALRLGFLQELEVSRTYRKEKKREETFHDFICSHACRKHTAALAHPHKHHVHNVQKWQACYHVRTTQKQVQGTMAALELCSNPWAKYNDPVQWPNMSSNENSFASRKMQVENKNFLGKLQFFLLALIYYP